LKIKGFGHREPHHSDIREGVHNLADAAREGVVESGAAVLMVHGTERFGHAGRSGGHEGGGCGVNGVVQEEREEAGGDLRHVTGDDQVPGGIRMVKCGEDSAERAFAGVKVGDGNAAGDRFAGADEDGATGSLFHLTGDGFDEGEAAKGQTSLIATHARTASAGQNVPRRFHIRMIPGAVLPKSGNSREMLPFTFQGTMRYCSKLMCGAVLVSAGLHAADSGQQYTRVTSVVRADARSGKLVRSVIVTPKAVTQQRVEESVIAPRVVTRGAGVDEPVAPSPAGIEDAVAQIAAQHSLNADLLHAVIKVESNYNPLAVSNKGALGMMQLIPATARRFGVSNVFNPVENIQGGARYLRYLLDLYHWDYPLALAAYNAGEGAVAKYGGVPPYRETQNYVNLVGRQFTTQKAKRAAKQAAAPKAETKEGQGHIQTVVDADGSVHYVSR
jgi:hypothetical protein